MDDRLAEIIVRAAVNLQFVCPVIGRWRRRDSKSATEGRSRSAEAQHGGSYGERSLVGANGEDATQGLLYHETASNPGGVQPTVRISRISAFQLL